MSEHWGLAKWGYREAAASAIIAGAVGFIVAYLASPPWAAIPAVIGLWAVSFFRDPARVVPDDPRAVVAPADGKIVEVSEVDEPDFIGGPCHKIGIFLSIFSVHINRAPFAGSVKMVQYSPGKFLNALKPDAAKFNENNSIGIETDFGPMLVRQIAGAIARRIACDCREGDSLERGQKFGMIKFGSRTELYIPVEAGFTPSVKVGDKVFAGSSIMGMVK